MSKRSLTLATSLVAALALAVVPAVSFAAVDSDVSPAASAVATGSPAARAAVTAMQPGWNLGNTFDAIGADETAWGNPRVTRELLRTVKNQGFKSIRIPVTWSNHQGTAPDYTIDPVWLARVKEVVDWALAENLYVMINLHHDSWQWVNTMPTQHDTVLARYQATWTQIAAAFKNAPPKLVLESVNEPQFSGSSGDPQNFELLNELNAAFVRIVRASGGNNAERLLVLPTLNTNAGQDRLDALMATFANLGDRNIAATVHFYGFWPFSVNIAGFTRYDATTEKDMTDTFDRVHDTFVANGIPVILGEYGLLGFDAHTGTIEQGEKLKFFEFMGNYAKSKKVTTMLWDNGQHLNRRDLRWNDPDLYTQIKSSWTVRSSTASTDQIFVRRSQPVASQTVTLNLNGNRLTNIVHGSKMLVRGKDYVISGDYDKLTFSAAALGRLTGDRAYGVNAVLSARFSRGVPWKFNVITFDTPVLDGAQGTTSSFAIGTTFNGNQLATMEAKYADGSNAGPQGWTPFKEFARAFSPDYVARQIVLPSAFFDEVRDGAPVTLTFHFWSGTKVQYIVTRSGTAVTGTPA